MKNFNNIKSITGKVTFNGTGSINNDSSNQKDALYKLGFKVNGANSNFNDNVTYQWYDQNGNIDGAINQKYQIESISFNDGFVQYGCRVELKEETNGQNF